MTRIIILYLLLVSACCPIGSRITNDPKSVVGYCMWCIPTTPPDDAGVSYVEEDRCRIGMENGTLFSCTFNEKKNENQN